MFKMLSRLFAAPPTPEQVTAERIEALRLSVGDTLVITSKSHLTTEQRQAIEAAASRRLPQGVHVMLLEGGLAVSAIHAASSAEAHAQLLTELRKNTAALKTIADCGIERMLRAVAV